MNPLLIVIAIQIAVNLCLLAFAAHLLDEIGKLKEKLNEKESMDRARD
jgi:hypothetical protein